MKLMNVGSRCFLIPDPVKPMDVIEVDDAKGKELAEGYPEEWKVIEAPKEQEAQKEPKKKRK